MKLRFVLTLLLAVSLCQYSCKNVPSAENLSATVDYTRYVDTRMGTEFNDQDCGKTFLGAVYPFGMVQMTPNFNTPSKGIAVNHISGAGCAMYGNFPVRPLNGRITVSPDEMKDFPLYGKINAATAGYLSLDYEDILTEVTASKRSGMIRMTFAEGEKEGSVAIGSGVNATFVTNSFVTVTSPRSCEGYAHGGSFCAHKADYTIYFAAEFNRPAVLTGTWNRSDCTDGRNEMGGNRCGAYFTFDVASDRQVEYRVAVSYVSVANAKENLKRDWNGRSFDQMRSDTRTVWNGYLSRIEVEDRSEDMKKQFYSHWYHCLIHPTVFNDVNGEYMGADYQLHHVEPGREAYTNYSGWDTYRTQCQMLAMFFPKQASDMMQTCVDFADQAGGYGRWVLANRESGVMHGDPIPILISSSYAFGARDFDIGKAYEHMKTGACVPGTYCQAVEVRPGLKDYMEKGVAPASLCLEYTSSDYAIGQFALQAMHDKALGEYFIRRAGNWKNLYDPSTGWLRSRNPDMSWKHPDADWKEGTFANYFWMVPHDLSSLIDTIGGKTAAARRLDSLFLKLKARYGEYYFVMANEPDFHVPWVYNWTDQPYKTSATVRRLIEEMYDSSPSGLPGNDDCGATASWFIYACLGIYPVIPGVAGFAVSAPQLDRVRLHLPEGQLTISRDRNATYISGVAVNGIPTGSWIDWSAIRKGGSIEFRLAEQPDLKWGLDVHPLK